MRLAATSSAFSVWIVHSRSAASISACVTRQRVGRERDAVEFRRQRQQRRVASRAHIGDDAAHGGGDILIGFALGVQQRLEGAGEIGRARIEAARHQAPPSWAGRPSAAHSPPISLSPPSMHSTVELHRAAAGEHQLDLAARILAARIFAFPGREADGQQRDHGIGLVAADIARLASRDAVEMQARTDARVVLRLPAEAVEQSREAARFRQIDEVLHLRHRILQPRGEDFEILGVLAPPMSCLFCHARKPFDIGADGGELLLQPFEAAVQMINAVDDGFALRRESRQHQRGRWPEDRWP